MKVGFDPVAAAEAEFEFDDEPEEEADDDVGVPVAAAEDEPEADEQDLDRDEDAEPEPEPQQEQKRHDLQSRPDHLEYVDDPGVEVGPLDWDERAAPDRERLDAGVRGQPDQRVRKHEPARATPLQPDGESEREEDQPVGEQDDRRVLLEELPHDRRRASPVLNMRRARGTTPRSRNVRLSRFSR